MSGRYPRLADAAVVDGVSGWWLPDASAEVGVECASALLSLSLDGVMVFRSVRDSHGAVVDFEWAAVNNAAARLVGRDGPALLGRSLLEEMPIHLELGMFERYVGVVDTGEVFVTELRVDADGVDRWLAIRAARVAGEQRDGFAVVFRDTTSEHRWSRTRAPDRHAAAPTPSPGRDDRDGTRHVAGRSATMLTQTFLSRRGVLESRLAHSVSRLARTNLAVGIFVVGIDDLHAIDDLFGVDAGDSVAIETARRLASLARPGDTVAHVGRDEVVFVGEDLSDEFALVDVAAGIVDSTTAAVEVAGRAVPVSTSVGVVMTRSEFALPVELIADGEVARSRAIAGGQHVVYSDPVLAERIATHHGVEVDLRRAIRRNEFDIDFEPVVHVASRRTVAVEATLRWSHATHGSLRHDSIVDLARNTGLVAELDHFILRQALAEHVAWVPLPNQNSPEGMIVRVSDAAVHECDLADRVFEVLAQNDVPPHWLSLAIDTNTLAGGASSLLDTLRRLSEGGVGIIRDHFGAPDSPLSYLREYPINTIRLDPSLTHHPGSREVELLRAIHEGVRHLDKTVIARDVASPEGLALFEELGTDYVQGPFITERHPIRDRRRHWKYHSTTGPGAIDARLRFE